jgi:SprT protein
LSALPDSNLVARLHAHTGAVLHQAAPLCARHRTPLPDPLIRCDLRGQAAGQAEWRCGQRPVLRYNLDIARRYPADFLAITIPHEVAHLITVACHGRTRPHGPEWRAVMAYLGIPNPSRCHSYSIDERRVTRQRRWPYACDCGRHELSTTRHKRVQAGTTRYQCRQCGGALRPARTTADGGL